MPKLTHAELCQSCGYTSKLVFDDGYVDQRPPTGHHHTCRKLRPRTVPVAEFLEIIARRQQEVC